MKKSFLLILFIEMRRTELFRNYYVGYGLNFFFCDVSIRERNKTGRDCAMIMQCDDCYEL